jgi:hypothetical protein
MRKGIKICWTVLLLAILGYFVCRVDRLLDRHERATLEIEKAAIAVQRTVGEAHRTFLGRD